MFEDLTLSLVTTSGMALNDSAVLLLYLLWMWNSVR